MKNIITTSATISATILVLILGLSTLKLHASQNQQPVEPNNAIPKPESTEKPRPRMDSVKMVNFYLKTRELISGKLAS